jgi:hypothetical protein
MASLIRVLASALVLAALAAGAATAQPASYDRRCLDEHNADPLLNTPALVALRLKIAGGEITEIEQFIARSVDAAKRVDALGRLTSGWSSWEDGMSNRARDVTRQ